MPRAKKGPAPKKRASKPRRQTGQKSHTRVPRQRGFLAELEDDVMRAVNSKTATRFLNWVSGRGDYKVSANSLVDSGAPPSFVSDGSGFRVRHREYIRDIVSPGAAFNNYPLAINPGLPETFPWLSSIAANFEEYELHGLLFEFRTLSAVAVSSTNTALGAVVLATNYDVYDPAFSNKQQMEAYEFSCSGPPCASLLHPVECAPRQTVNPLKYVRTNGTVPPSGDLRMYDMGLFQIATVGQQAQSSIGELWVTYDIKFLKPKLPAVVGEIIPATSIACTPISGVGDFSSTKLMPGSTIDVDILSPTSFRINRNGRFVIRLMANSTNTYSASVADYSESAGATECKNAYWLQPIQQGNATQLYMSQWVVDCVGDSSGPGGTITKAPPTIVGVSLASLTIQQIPSNLDWTAIA